MINLCYLCYLYYKIERNVVSMLSVKGFRFS